jgi:restriction system protein
VARREQGLLNDLAEMPWWASVIVGVICYLGMRFGAPALSSGNPLSEALAQAISQYAWVSVIFVLPMLVSLAHAARKRRQLDRQSGIESIRDLTWKQFEELLGEAYRRQGFSVTENRGAGADGGIDLVIRRDGATYLVQCKQWKTYKVGVKVVREMLGLVTAHSATGAIIVASGVFTKEALDFARAQPVELVDGDALVRLVSGVQRGAAAAPVMPAVSVASRECPQCGKALIVRQAKRGPQAGGRFWGCAGYPACRYTESIAD